MPEVNVTKAIAQYLTEAQDGLVRATEALQCLPDVAASKVLHELLTANEALTRVLRSLALTNDCPALSSTQPMAFSELRKAIAAAIQPGTLTNIDRHHPYGRASDEEIARTTDVMLELYTHCRDNLSKQFTISDLKGAKRLASGGVRANLIGFESNVLREAGLIERVNGRERAYRLTAMARELFDRVQATPAVSSSCE